MPVFLLFIKIVVVLLLLTHFTLYSCYHHSTSPKGGPDIEISLYYYIVNEMNCLYVVRSVRVLSSEIITIKYLIFDLIYQLLQNYQVWVEHFWIFSCFIQTYFQIFCLQLQSRIVEYHNVKKCFLENYSCIENTAISTLLYDNWPSISKKEISESAKWFIFRPL